MTRKFYSARHLYGKKDFKSFITDICGKLLVVCSVFCSSQLLAKKLVPCSLNEVEELHISGYSMNKVEFPRSHFWFVFILKEKKKKSESFS